MATPAIDNLSIPIIDLEPVRTGTPEQTAQVAKEVYHAFKHAGFAYIQNHGVPQELIDEAFRWVRLGHLTIDHTLQTEHYPFPEPEILRAVAERQRESAPSTCRLVPPRIFGHRSREGGTNDL